MRDNVAAEQCTRRASPGHEVLRLDGVSREYGKAHVTALSDVSLAVEQGECVAIMGPSGSGKSTLLHVMCGMDAPTRGRALFEGRDPGSRAAWTRIRSRRIGFVFQAFNLLPALTAAENVEVPMFGTGRGSAERRRRVAELLERVGLVGRAGHRPAELSGGERQRVAIARSLANAPDVLLADEPTGNLDSKTSAAIIALLMDIHAREGTTLVVVTHDRAIARRASRLAGLLDGRIVPLEEATSEAPCDS